MGASASRIWKDICELESDTVRISMIEAVLTSADMVYEAKRAGVYAHVLFWVSDCRNGKWVRFPYGKREPIQHVDGYGRAETQIVVSAAAKALDYFQQSLALLGIDEAEGITVERLKAGYRAASLRAHPDKGGSKEAFDEVVRAYKYVERILARINPRMSAEDKARLTAPVTLETAKAARQSLDDVKPIQLSSKKLDMSTFNKLFEDNRLPDAGRDTGYGDWLSSTNGSDEIVADPRLKGKFNQQAFEQVFREKAIAQTAGTAIVRRLEPDAIMAASGVELGGSTDNFTAAFGAETQFTDLKEAYTTGSTRFHEVADVRMPAKSARSLEETKRQREVDLARADPDEKARFAAAAAAFEDREKQRRLRLAQQDTAGESWADHMRRRLLVSDK